MRSMVLAAAAASVISAGAFLNAAKAADFYPPETQPPAAEAPPPTTAPPVEVEACLARTLLQFFESDEIGIPRQLRDRKTAAKPEDPRSLVHRRRAIRYLAEDRHHEREVERAVLEGQGARIALTAFEIATTALLEPLRRHLQHSDLHIVERESPLNQVACNGRAEVTRA